MSPPYRVMRYTRDTTMPPALRCRFERATYVTTWRCAICLPAHFRHYATCFARSSASPDYSFAARAYDATRDMSRRCAICYTRGALMRAYARARYMRQKDSARRARCYGYSLLRHRHLSAESAAARRAFTRRLYVTKLSLLRHSHLLLSILPLKRRACRRQALSPAHGDAPMLRAFERRYKSAALRDAHADARRACQRAAMATCSGSCRVIDAAMSFSAALQCLRGDLTLILRMARY